MHLNISKLQDPVESVLGFLSTTYKAKYQYKQKRNVNIPLYAVPPNPNVLESNPVNQSGDKKLALQTNPWSNYFNFWLNVL